MWTPLPIPSPGWEGITPSVATMPLSWEPIPVPATLGAVRLSSGQPLSQASQIPWEGLEGAAPTMWTPLPIPSPGWEEITPPGATITQVWEPLPVPLPLGGVRLSLGQPLSQTSQIPWEGLEGAAPTMWTPLPIPSPGWEEITPPGATITQVWEPLPVPLPLGGVRLSLGQPLSQNPWEGMEGASPTPGTPLSMPAPVPVTVPVPLSAVRLSM